MTYDAAVALDPVGPGPLVPQDVLQQEVPFNEDANALSPAGIFAVNQRLSNGLLVALHGGNWPNSDGTISVILPQFIRLTPSATNDVYATVAGVATKVTSPPSGWPGPLANSARALHRFATDANGITGYTCYLIGGGFVGPAGPTGPQGPAGNEIYLRRQRWLISGFTTSDRKGFDAELLVGNNTGMVAFDSSFFTGGIERRLYNSGAASGASSSIRSPSNYWFRGNAAGRGGFDVTRRFGFQANFSTNVTMRSFFGMFDASGGALANADPDSFINIVGVGGKAGDNNLSIINNDGSGTATVTALGSNFPMRNSDDSYELRLQCDAHGSAINYTITNLGTGISASGALSSNIPADTQFLGWVWWVNTGTNTNNTGFLFMQQTGSSRF